MWSARPSIPKGLFFLVRYGSFAHMGVSLGYHLVTGNVGAQCHAPFNRIGFSSVVIAILCDSIGLVRVYGFSGRKRIILIPLTLLFGSCSSMQLYFLWKFTTTMKFAELPWKRIGCIPIAGEGLWLSLVFKLFLVELVTVTSIMIFIAYRGRQSGVKGLSGIVRLFYRDGILYFLAAAAFSVANIVVDHTAPPDGTRFTMVQLKIFLNSIFIERMLLHLRAWAKQDVQYSTAGKKISEMQSQTYLAELEFSDGRTQATLDLPLRMRQDPSTTVFSESSVVEGRSARSP